MKKQLFFFCFLGLALTACTSKSPTYTIETSLGNIKVRLYEKTPLHRENFEKLVGEHYYDSLQFHRVIQHFMIQAGNAETRNLAPEELPLGSGEPDYTIPPEFVTEYIHKKGALAAARTGDDLNPEKRSSGSQFYIVQGRTFTPDELSDVEAQNHKSYDAFQRKTYLTLGGAPFLDGNYTVFGEVVEGLDVVDKIAALPTGSKDWPLKDIRIIRIVKD